MNTLNLELLKTFYFVAKHGSLSSAAKFLNHPKSKLSKDMNKLEDELKTQLLVRSAKGIKLTDQGISFLRETQTSIERLLESQNLLSRHIEELEGAIKVTAPEDISEVALIPFVHNFQLLHPKVRIELSISTEIIDFNTSDIDFAIRIGKLKDSSLKQQKICDVYAKYFATKDYIRSNPKISSLKDLSDHPLAVIKTSEGELVSNLSFGKDSITIASNSVRSLKQLALYGNHIVTLPTFYMKDEVRQSKISNILQDSHYFKGGVYLLYRPARYTPLHIQEFKLQLLKFLRNTLDN